MRATCVILLKFATVAGPSIGAGFGAVCRSVIDVASVAEFAGVPRRRSDGFLAQDVFGLHELPRKISSFELQAFFTFSPIERVSIEQRRGDTHKLSRALHMAFCTP